MTPNHHERQAAEGGIDDADMEGKRWYTTALFFALWTKDGPRDAYVEPLDQGYEVELREEAVITGEEAGDDPCDWFRDGKLIGRCRVPNAPDAERAVLVAMGKYGVALDLQDRRPMYLASGVDIPADAVEVEEEPDVEEEPEPEEEEPSEAVQQAQAKFERVAECVAADLMSLEDLAKAKAELDEAREEGEA